MSSVFSAERGLWIRRILEREANLQLAIDREFVVTQPSEFSRVFETHHGLIFRTAYRITGNAADAEDVLQTIFLRLLRQSPAAQPVEKEESYFRRSAINASLDLLRTRQNSHTVRLSDSSLQAIRPAGGYSPGADLSGVDLSGPDLSGHDLHDLKECLRRAFARLSPRSAEIFALRHFEDFSNRQIAEALHISQVLVAVTLHRTRRQLQKEIRSCMGGQK